MIRRINFFGGPHSGKSSIGPFIYSRLKKNHYLVEQAPEFIKDWTYIKRNPEGFDQVFLFGNQLHREELPLKGGCDLIVSDSPLYLQAFYSEYYKLDIASVITSLCDKFEKKYPSLNIFLNRPDCYSQIGRYHTKDEAVVIDKALIEFLINKVKIENLVYYDVADEDGILKYILEKLEKK